MKLRSAIGALSAALLISTGCTASLTNTSTAERQVPAASVEAELTPAAAATGGSVETEPTRVSTGCDVGLSLEPNAETESVLDESADSFEFDTEDSRYDSDSWIVASPTDPDGLRFQVWRFDSTFSEDQVFDGEVNGFEYLHYADEDRGAFNGLSGRLVDTTAVVVVLTLNGTTQNTLDFLGSVGQVLDGAVSVGDLSVIRSGTPKDVLETADLAETLHWNERSTRIRALHVCGSAVAPGNFTFADALTISSPFSATQTYVSGEESVTPISIGGMDGFLLDIDGGSNDDYLVGAVGSAERAVIFTIVDSGADLKLGLSIVDRLRLDPV